MAERMDARYVFTLKSAYLLLESPISELDIVVDLELALHTLDHTVSFLHLLLA
jgi:hypothetical protein